MRRLPIAIVFVLLITVSSGCSVAGNTLKSDSPHPTKIAVQTVSIATADPNPTAYSAEPSPTHEVTLTPSPAPEATLAPSPTPEETMPEPTKIIPKTNIYTSTGLGFTFTVPESWVGKYRVEEGDGYLSVYFNPVKQDDAEMAENELFSIAKKSFDLWTICGDWEFGLNGITYTWGIFDGLDHGELNPEYKSFTKMENEVSAVFQTIRSKTAQTPEHIKKLWIEVIPTKTAYTTTMGLGLAFTLPKSWIGKCRVMEDEMSVTLYFKPKEAIDDGDGFLFIIGKKTADDNIYDDYREFKINGATYYHGTSSDVSYSEEQPEYNTFIAMLDDLHAIYHSIKAARGT